MTKSILYYLGTPLSLFTLTYEEGAKLIDFFTPHFIDLKISGEENIPKEGSCIIAANHESYLDILLLGAIPKKRHFHFVAKKELFENDGFFGSYLKTQIQKFYAAPIDRQEPKIDQIKTFMQKINEGHIMAIFPEGTRTEGLSEFKNLAAMLAYGKDVPVIPTGIVGTKKAESHLLDFGYRPPVEINFGEPMYCRKIFDEDKKETWKKFNWNLRSEVGRLMGLEEIASKP